MPLRLYNTRTRSEEPFQPLRDNEVRMYVCGLTPSAQAHIGHARSFLFFDVLRRYLEHSGFRVHYVQNVTDIDDRSIKRSQQTGEPWHDIVMGFYNEFKTSMRALGVREPDDEPYATQYIDAIQRMIVELIERGAAYVTQDGIYYSVAAFPNYGKLSNRNVEELESGARIEVDEHKNDPLDFALWKFAKPGEPKWPFQPYGEGRPGWHIECSAMSHELLDREGLGFDIHGGGADLIFPHHENEIAQSEPLMKRPPMANFWVYGGLLLFDSRKMSKSLGNFEPLSDLVARYDPQAIRLLFLQTGYSKVMNFTEESIGAAALLVERLKRAYRAMAAVASPEGNLRANGLLERVELALDANMNTSVALAETLSFASTWERAPHPESAQGEFAYVLSLLGIEPSPAWMDEPKAELPADLLDRLRGEIGDEIAFNGATPERAVELVVERRSQARASKNWSDSDRLRDVLARCGITIKDSKEGTTWTVAE